MTLSAATVAPCPPPAGMTPRPGQVVCGDIDMRIDANGTWYYMGSPIEREKLVRLFSTVVRRDADGAYWLITPAEMARITVEDAPFLAIEMAEETKDGKQVLRFRTNVERWVAADAEHPIRVETDPKSGEPRPYIRLAEDGTEARINRAVFYELVDKARERDINGATMLAVESDGATFVLGALAPTAEET